MATQATYLTNIRNKLDETTSGQWSDAELRTWINEAARDIARRTESLQTYEEINVTGKNEMVIRLLDAGTQMSRLHPTRVLLVSISEFL